MDEVLVQQILDQLRNRYFGKYRGTVVDNEDPTSRGRLKVRVPAVLRDVESWAMPCVPYAGEGVGFYCLPEPDAGIWVEFEGGDPSYPIWTGCFWGDGQIPDESRPSVRIWKTESLTVRIDDDHDEIVVENENGSRWTLSSGVATESGGATLTVGTSGVVSEKGAAKSEVTDAAFRVNDGALEVI